MSDEPLTRREKQFIDENVALKHDMTVCEKCLAWTGNDEVSLNPFWMDCARRDCPRMRVELNRLRIDEEVRP